MDRTHHIYLVPGFLGFANLGRITYFGHVRRVLTERDSTRTGRSRVVYSGADAGPRAQFSTRRSYNPQRWILR